MRISMRQLIGIGVQILTLVIVLVFEMAFQKQNNEFQLNLVAILSIAILLESLFHLYRLKNKFDSYAILVFLIFIFMFGQHWLYLFEVYPKNLTLISGRISSEALYKTGFIVLKSVLLLNTGYLVTCKNTIDAGKKIKTVNNQECERLGVWRTGVLFFVISLVPTIIVIGKNIFLTFTVGYAERMINTAYRTSGIENIAGIISSFMVPALLAMFISRRDSIWPVWAMAVYMVLYTLSGSRINTMILLVGTLYIQSNLFKRIDFKKAIKYGVLLIVVMLLFGVVSTARMYINDEANFGQVIKDSMNDTVENGIVVSTLTEAGYTFCATATVVDNCPSKEPYNYGKSYLSAVAYILPNGLTGNYYAKVRSTDDVFKGYLNPYGSGIGSSFIAEAYWNFGGLSLLIMFIFGLLLGKLCGGIDRAIRKKDYMKLFAYTYVLIIVAFYVRSDTRTFLRNYVWFCLPMLTVAYHIKNKILKERKRKTE